MGAGPGVPEHRPPCGAAGLGALTRCSDPRRAAMTAAPAPRGLCPHEQPCAAAAGMGRRTCRRWLMDAEEEAHSGYTSATIFGF